MAEALSISPTHKTTVPLAKFGKRWVEIGQSSADIAPNTSELVPAGARNMLTTSPEWIDSNVSCKFRFFASLSKFSPTHVWDARTNNCGVPQLVLLMSAPAWPMDKSESHRHGAL